MRPPLQTIKALRADLKHLHRMHERAQANTERKPDRSAEVRQLFSRLIVLFTQETVEPGALTEKPSPAAPPAKKNAKVPMPAPTKNGSRHRV